MNYVVQNPGFGQMFGVPNLVVDEYLRIATPVQLRVLLLLLRHCGSLSDEEIAQTLGITPEVAAEAMGFWLQTALFRTAGPSPEEAAQRKVTLRRTKDVTMTPLEIAASLEGSEDLHSLFDLCAQALGHPLHHTEQKILVWLHDGVGIPSDIILTVLGYCQSVDKGSLSYAEELILNCWSDGLRTLAEYNDLLREKERRQGYESMIRRHFGQKNRLTDKQQAIVDNWQRLGINEEMVACGIEFAIDAGKTNPTIPYVDKILLDACEAKCYTAAEMKARHARQKETIDEKAVRKGGRSKPVQQSENAERYRNFSENLRRLKKKEQS